jgi:hypothetical protein
METNKIDTFFCPACRRDLPKRGKAYKVGNPTTFLVCIDCWKGFFGRQPKISKFYKGTIMWKKKEVE